MLKNFFELAVPLDHSGFDIPRTQACFPFCFCPVDTGVVKDTTSTRNRVLWLVRRSQPVPFILLCSSSFTLQGNILFCIFIYICVYIQYICVYIYVYTHKYIYIHYTQYIALVLSHGRVIFFYVYICIYSMYTHTHIYIQYIHTYIYSLYRVYCIYTLRSRGSSKCSLSFLFCMNYWSYIWSLIGAWVDKDTDLLISSQTQNGWAELFLSAKASLRPN